MKNSGLRFFINFFLLFGFVLASGAGVQAQNKTKKPVKKKDRVLIASTNQESSTIVDNSAKTLPVPQNTPTPITTQAEINVPRAETTEIRTFENGSIVVQVTSNSNATVKIPLAAGGVSVIEFPKDDPAIAIHPGDENLVSLDCKKRDESGYCTELANLSQTMVIRPTAEFRIKSGGETTPMTAITVQRRSGMVVSFICYPVADLTQNAFHVVVRYDPVQVVRARQEAGLPTDLDVPTQIQLNAAKNANNPNSTQTDANNPQPTEAEKREAELAEMTVNQLKAAVKNTQKWVFSKPIHGLSVAVAARQNRTDDTVVETIAVKNTLNVPVRLVPDQPELFIRQSDGNKQSAIVSRVTILHVASTAPETDVLQPGQVYYYSIAYKLPVLGAKQSLWISFAQMNAADEPVQVDLTINAR